MAAVLSPDQEIVHAPLAEITKWEDGPDGSLYVYGRATTPEVDTDEQILKESWSGPALQEWMEKAPTIRVQHNGLRDPAGSGVRVEINRDGDGAHWVKGVVDEPIAQRLVRKGHLRAFSVGVAAPVIERDMTGKAKGASSRAAGSWRSAWSTRLPTVRASWRWPRPTRTAIRSGQEHSPPRTRCWPRSLSPP